MQEVPLPIYTAQDERVQRLEALVGRLIGDYSIGATFFGPLPGAPSAVSLRRTGAYYPSNALGMALTASTPGVTTANRLYAAPFYTPSVPNIADRIALIVTNAGGANARLGIYDSDRTLYPSHLLLDAGTVSTGSGGVKTKTIRQGLSRGLKWLVVVFSGTPTVRKADSGYENTWAPLGFDPATLFHYLGWYVAFSYAALPARYPTGGAATTWEPLLLLRFAV